MEDKPPSNPDTEIFQSRLTKGGQDLDEKKTQESEEERAPDEETRAAASRRDAYGSQLQRPLAASTLLTDCRKTKANMEDTSNTPTNMPGVVQEACYMTRSRVKKTPKTMRGAAAPNASGGQNPAKSTEAAISRATTESAQQKVQPEDFYFEQCSLMELQRVKEGSHDWVHEFGLAEFLDLPWQNIATRQERQEFLQNLVPKEEVTTVQGKEIKLNIEALARAFHISHGSLRIEHGTNHVSPHFATDENLGCKKDRFKLSQCNANYWAERYVVLLSLLCLQIHRYVVSRGFVAWVEAENKDRDLAHEFHRNFWRELKRLKGTKAHDWRSLSTSIGPHLAILIAGGNEETLRPSSQIQEEPEEDGSDIRPQVQEPIIHIGGYLHNLDELDQERDELQKQLQCSIQEATATRSQEEKDLNAQLREETERQKAELANLQQQLDKRGEEVTELAGLGPKGSEKAVRPEDKDLIAQLRDQTEQQQTEMENLQQELQESEVELIMLADEVKGLKRSKRTLRQKYKDFIAQLQEKIQQQKTELENLQRKLHEREDSTDSPAGSTMSLAKISEKEGKDFTVSGKKLTELAHKVKGLKRSKKALQQELAETKGPLAKLVFLNHPADEEILKDLDFDVVDYDVVSHSGGFTTQPNSEDIPLVAQN